MLRSVQTMIFMPLASVVVFTWSRPGTRGVEAGLVDLAGFVAAKEAAEKIVAASTRTPERRSLMDMRCTSSKGRASLYERHRGARHYFRQADEFSVTEKESAANGGSRLR